MYIFFILIGLLIILYLYSQKRPKHYPPGPYGIPIIGHLLHLGSSPFLTLIKLKEKYGPIVAVDFGSYRAIGISDYKILREALADPAFTGRPDINVFRDRSRDVIARGLLFTDGRQWTEQRRFTIRQLKDLGYARSSLETMITDEIVEFIAQLRNECDHPISIRTKFHASILNIIWSLIVGERSNNEEITSIFRMCTRTIEENNGLASMCMFIPWFAKLFPGFSGLDEMNRDLEPLWEFFERHINQHKSTFIPGQIRDFLDAYIQEIANTTDPDSSFYKEVGERSMLSTLLDLFFAGGETTANTIHWICLHLAAHQDAQKMLQQEIDTVIGHSRKPQLSDESSMPYTFAVIQESMRLASLVPFGIFHSTTNDVTLRGYKIPKDTMVLMNIYSALRDKEYWKPDPETFRPERHIDSNGKIIKHDPMLTFSVGKRVCIGETLARNELFLWVTSLFQNFSVTPDPEKPNISLEPIVTWILLPPDHHLVFKQRHVMN